MFPLRDTIRSRSFPYVTWALVAVCTGVFLLEISSGGSAFEKSIATYGLVASRLSLGKPESWLMLVTSVFLHGSWLHLISNMWILFIFGDNVEDRMGHARYLGFYLLAGVVAGLTQVSFAPTSSVPTVGASGAIAGVLGAYFVLYPTARVTTLIPLFILPWLIDIPAFVFLGIWFLTQVSSGLLGLGAAGDFSGIAWWAHIGGFLFGILMVWPLTRRRVTYRVDGPPS